MLNIGFCQVNFSWSLRFCTDGAATFSVDERQFLLAQNVRIIETPLVDLQRRDARMDTLVLSDGMQLARRARTTFPESAPRVI